MKNPRNVLKATTAIVVSLSFLSANAIAAEAGLRDLVLAQNEVLPKQAEGKAKGKEKKEAAAAEEAAEEGSIEQAEEGEQGEEDTAAAEAAEEAEEAAEESVEAAEKAEETAEESAEAAAAAAAAAKQVAQNAAETAEDATLPLTEEEAASEAGAAETTAEEAAATDEAAAEEPAAEATSTEAAESEPTSAETTAEETTATEATSTEATEATGTEATPTEATEATGAEAAASSETGSGSTAGETTAGSETTAEGEPVMMQSTEESGATAETTSDGTETGSTDETATDTTGQGPSETVEQVSEQQIEQATSSGNDVVIQETTSVEELQAQMQESTVQDVSELDDAEPDEVEEEVITDETSRSSDEEVTTTAASSSSDDDDDDDNDIWKYLGAAAAGAAVGALIPALGGRLVQNQGDRMIVERNGEFYVRKDENQLLRQPGVRVQTETFPDGLTRTTVIRDDGSRVVTIRDEGGFILRRTSIAPDGTEYVLIDDSPQQIFSFTNWDDELPPLTIDMPDDRYIVDYSRASDDVLRQTLMAEMVGDVDRTFSLREVRENERVRALVPRIDLDAINFDTGSAAIKQSEARDLAELGTMMREVIQQNPREIFLVEGHTDAVGSNLMNLALSDRRAEAVALALTEYYDIPPENLVVQGYGERYLKEQTEGPSQVNRRATVRRITPLIDRVASNN